MVSLHPAHGDDAPAVTWREPGKVPLRVRSNEIVADCELVTQKLLCHDGTHSVATGVFRARAATAVAIEAGDGVDATLFKGIAENISFGGLGHLSSVSATALT